MAEYEEEIEKTDEEEFEFSEDETESDVKKFHASSESTENKKINKNLRKFIFNELINIKLKLI